MSDIFISYARKDRDRAKPLAEALEAQGWAVWWDPKIPPGKTFADVIDDEISAVKCILALWSKVSIKKNWVLEEAQDGLERGILVPVLVEDVKPPRGFRRIQAANLIEWDGSERSPGFQTLVSSVADILGPPPVAVAEEKRKAEEEAKRKRQEEAERLKAKEQAAKQEAALDAKRKADEEKVKQAEEEARRKAETEKQRLAEEQEAQSKVEEPPASQITKPVHPPNPSAGRRLPMTGLVVLGCVIIAAILVVVITEREPARESYRPAVDAPAQSTRPLKPTRSAQEIVAKQREERPEIKLLSQEDAKKLREEQRKNIQSPGLDRLSRYLSSVQMESIKVKLKQNSKYESNGIKLRGKERFSLKNKLKAVGINATTYDGGDGDKIRLYCSDITDEQVEALILYLGINVNIRILRDGLPGGSCSGGNNQVEIYFGTGSF